MKPISIVADFAKWLHANRDRFPAPLVCIAREGDRRVYRFRGVHSLRVWVGCHTLEIAVMYRRRFIDLLGDFDVVPLRDAAGSYYCRICKSEGHAEYMKDRMALLASDGFEPFLAWCKDYVHENALLVVEEEAGSRTGARKWTGARIVVSRKKLKPHLHPGVIVEPLFQASGSVPGRRV